MTTAEYQRGYRAGRKKTEGDALRARMQYDSDRRFNEAFLAVLPICMESQTWKRGDKPIASVQDRIQLANEIALAAMEFVR
jgi:hypothetical protein